MLGWEFPPDVSGGLGTACRGLAHGLSRRDVDVLFVVPREPGGAADEPGSAEPGAARVVSCDRLSAELGPRAQAREPQGRESEDELVLRSAGARGEAYRSGDRLPPNRLELLPVASPLRPYLSERAYAEQRARSPEAGPSGFAGGYGATLGDEVARYADVVGELARRERFDLIHAHDWMTFPAGVRARALAGRPLVCHVHACEYDRNGDAPDARIVQIERQGLGRADRIAAVSRYTAGVLRERYHVDPARLRVVHNGVERPEPLEAPSPAAGSPLVLFVGRLTAQKGPDRFLAAAERVARAAPEARFLMCGDGELREATIAHAARLGLADRVAFPGFLGGADLERAYRSASVLVVPSVSEPFGLVGLEALARDLPVIVPRRCGVAEVARGCLKVDSADVDDLADKILSVLRRPALRRQLVEDGRRDVRRLGWDESAATLLAVYRELVA